MNDFQYIAEYLGITKHNLVAKDWLVSVFNYFELCRTEKRGYLPTLANHGIIGLLNVYRTGDLSKYP